MILRRASATVLISMGVAAGLLSACSAQTGNEGSGGSRATSTSTGTGTGAGATTGSGGSMGTGGSTGTGATGGATGTGGTIGPPPINPGNPEAGADSKPMADAACGMGSTKGEKKPTDLLVMMDSSGSMLEMDMGQTGTRWDNLKMAMPGFVNDPANAGMMIGLDYFPEGSGNNVCNVADYSMPNVPIAALPGNAQPFLDSINARMPANGTPTGPALTGAIATARDFQAKNPDRSVNVLLMTDGQPTGCGVSMANPTGPAVMAAQAGLNGTPPIKTYVLGVGPSTGNLDAIAVAGGTMKAFMVTSGGAADLSKALAEIRKSTLTCDYNVPKGDGGAIDLKRVSVTVRVGPAPGMFVELVNVIDQSGCADMVRNPGGFGWYYDFPPPATPTKIVLCPNSCGPLQMADGSEVSILLGCTPPVIPPPN